MVAARTLALVFVVAGCRGQGPELAEGLEGPLAVDDTNVYAYVSKTDELVKVEKTGGDLVTLAADAERYYHILAADGSFVYWAESDDLLRVPVAGGACEVIATYSRWPYAMALDDTHVYLVGHETVDFDGRIYKVPKQGGLPITLVGADYSVQDVAVDDEAVYFVNWSWAVWKVPKDGGTPEILASETELTDLPHRIAVDDTFVYWSRRWSPHDGGLVVRIAKGGGTPFVIAEDTGDAEIALTEHSVFWFDDWRRDLWMASKDGGDPQLIASNVRALVSDGTSVYFLSEGTLQEYADR